MVHGKQKGKSTKTDQGKNISTHKPNAFVVGNALEYRLQRLYMFMGYFVRRSKPINTIENLDHATDLDVYACRFVESFRREIGICECKSGGEGPLDRIFWLSGLKNYLNANEALLIRKGTKWNIKDFAKQCQVQVIDLFRIEELEKNFKIDSSDWPGLSDMNFISGDAESWNKALSSDTKIWELYNTLTSEIRFNDPFPAINYLMSQMRILTKTMKSMPSDSFYRYLFVECISQLLIFCMRVSESCFDLKKDDREGYIRKGLTYGSMEPRYAERFLQSAFNLAQQAVFYYTNKTIHIDESLFKMSIPPETEGVMKIVSGILNSYPLSLKLPQVCDLLLSELFTKKYKPTGLLKKVFPQQLLSPFVELVKDYLKILTEMDACPEYILETLKIESTEKDSRYSQESKSESSVINDAVIEPAIQTKLNKNEKVEEPPIIWTEGL